MLSLPVADGRNPRRRKATEAPPENELSAALKRHRRPRLYSSDGEEDEDSISTRTTKGSQRGGSVRYVPDNDSEVGLQRIKHQLKVSPSHASNSGCSNLLEGLSLQQENVYDSSGSFLGSADGEDLSSVALGPIRATALSFVPRGEDILRKASSFADLAAQAAAVPRTTSNTEIDVSGRRNIVKVPNSPSSPTPLRNSPASVTWEVPVTRTGAQTSGNTTSSESFVSHPLNTSTTNASSAARVARSAADSLLRSSLSSEIAGAASVVASCSPRAVPSEAAASSPRASSNTYSFLSSLRGLPDDKLQLKPHPLHSIDSMADSHDLKSVECDDEEEEEEEEEERLRAAFLERERNRRHRGQLPVRVHGPSGSYRATAGGTTYRVMCKLLRVLWVLAPWMGLLATLWFRRVVLMPQASHLGNSSENGENCGDGSGIGQRCHQYHQISLGSSSSNSSWREALAAAVGCTFELASEVTHDIVEVRK